MITEDLDMRDTMKQLDEAWLMLKSMPVQERISYIAQVVSDDMSKYA